MRVVVVAGFAGICSSSGRAPASVVLEHLDQCHANLRNWLQFSGWERAAVVAIGAGHLAGGAYTMLKAARVREHAERIRRFLGLATPTR